jgi:transposase
MSRLETEELKRLLEIERDLKRKAESERDAALSRAAELEEKIAAVESQDSEKGKIIEALRADLARLKKAMAQAEFGRKSEKRDAEGQTVLPFNDEMAADQAKPISPAVPDAPTPCPVKGKPASRVRTGRNALSSLLRREKKFYSKSPAELDALYGVGQWREIAPDTREELELRRTELLVIEHIISKYAPIDGRSAPVRAQAPRAVIPKARPGPGLLAYLITAKFDYHLPLYRLEKALRRMGGSIGRSSMCFWLSEAAILLEGIIRTLKAELIASGVVRLDDTPVTMLDETRDSGSSKSFMWPFMNDERQVVFLWTRSKGRAGPAEFLGDFQGWLQGDGANVNKSLAGDGVIFVGCWAHARRYFFKICDDFPKECDEILDLIDGLYAVEAEAKIQGLSPDGVGRLRQKKSVPIMVAIKDWASKKRTILIPGTGLADAVDYLLNNFGTLQHFLSDGRLAIDNNDVEREIRNVVIGRKNYLFFGGERGGQVAAVFYTLIANCRLENIDPEVYLKDVLVRTTTESAKSIAALTPRAWKKQRDPATAALAAT